jgi:hypothetical protein
VKICILWKKVEQSTFYGNIAGGISSVKALDIRDVEVCR